MQGGNTASASIEVSINDIVSESFSPPAIPTSDGEPVSSTIVSGGLTFIRPPRNTEQTCVGSTVDSDSGVRYCNINHADSLDYCAGLAGGYRMPTEQELIDHLLPLMKAPNDFQNVHHWPVDKTYWSSTSGTAADRFRVLRFSSLNTINWNPTGANRVVCVRP